MAFKKGQSGNPTGRPKDKRTHQLREMLRSDSADLIRKVKQMALEGDSTAMRLCLERVLPPLKTKDEPVTVKGLNGSTSLVEQGQAIVNALAAGELSPGDAATLMQAIANQARIVEVDELERRVAALEKQ